MRVFGLVRIALVHLLVIPSIVAAETIEGFSEPYVRIDLSVPEPGTFSEVNVTVGERVSKSQIVASLNTQVLEKSLEIAKQRAKSEGTLKAADAELRLRKQRFQKVSELHQRNHISQNEFEQSRADVQIAESRKLSALEDRIIAELEVQRIQAQIDQRKLKSPIDGVVSHVYRDVGESHSPNEPAVMTIVQLDRLKARFSMGPAWSAGFDVGKQVRLFFPDTNSTAIAVVENISPTIDAKSGEIEITVVFSNKQGQFRSGARCQLEIGASIAKKPNAGFQTAPVSKQRRNKR